MALTLGQSSGLPSLSAESAMSGAVPWSSGTFPRCPLDPVKGKQKPGSTGAVSRLGQLLCPKRELRALLGSGDLKPERVQLA